MGRARLRHGRASARRREATRVVAWIQPALLPPAGLALAELIITHNFRELRERPKGQVVDNKKGAADNKL